MAIIALAKTAKNPIRLAGVTIRPGDSGDVDISKLTMGEHGELARWSALDGGNVTVDGGQHTAPARPDAPIAPVALLSDNEIRALRSLLARSGIQESVSTPVEQVATTPATDAKPPKK